MKIKLNIEGMMCEHCANAAKQALSEVAGVESVKVDLKKKSAKVKCDDSIDTALLIKAVADAGYKAELA